MTLYVPKPLRGSSVKNGFFTKEQFHYDADADNLICPGGQKLEPKYNSKIRDNDAMTYVNRKACKTCDLRVRCTNAAFRKVTRYANEAILDRMAERFMVGGGPFSHSLQGFRVLSLIAAINVLLSLMTKYSDLAPEEIKLKKRTQKKNDTIRMRKDPKPSYYG